MMRLILSVLLALLVAQGALFLVLQLRGGRPAGDAPRQLWWQLTWMAVFIVIEAAVLLMVVQRVDLPRWMYPLVYGAMNVVTFRWLLLRWRSRRSDRSGYGDSTA